MTAPNIVNTAVITGKSIGLALTTSAQALASNAASSGKVYKINTLYISNVDTVNSATVTVYYYTAAALGGTAFAVARVIPVPAGSTLMVLDRNSPIWLEENTSLGALASASGDLEAVCSWEEIS